MLVFPPPFKRKCHPRCAKQILDFTFLLQIVKGGPREIPGLVWWLVFWMDPCSRGAGRIIHTYLNFPKFHPTSINLDAFIPFYCEQGKLAPPCGGQTPSRGAPTDWLQPTGSFPKGGMIPDPTFPNIPEGSHLLMSFWAILPSAKKGIFPFLKTLSDNWGKDKKIRCFPWQVNLVCLNNFWSPCTWGIVVTGSQSKSVLPNPLSFPLHP